MNNEQFIAAVVKKIPTLSTTEMEKAKKLGTKRATIIQAISFGLGVGACVAVNLAYKRFAG